MGMKGVQETLPNASWTVTQYNLKSKVPIWVGAIVNVAPKVPVYASRSYAVSMVSIGVYKQDGHPHKATVPIYTWRFSVPPDPVSDTSTTWPIVVRVWNYLVQSVNVFAQFIGIAASVNMEYSAILETDEVKLTSQFVGVNPRPVDLFFTLDTTEWSYKMFWEARGDMVTKFLTTFCILEGNAKPYLIADVFLLEKALPQLKTSVVSPELQGQGYAKASIVAPEVNDTIQMKAAVNTGQLDEITQMKADVGQGQLNETTQMKIDLGVGELNQITQMKADIHEMVIKAMSQLHVAVGNKYLQAKAFMKVSLLQPFIGPVMNFLSFRVRWYSIWEKRKILSDLIQRFLHRAGHIFVTTAEPETQRAGALHVQPEFLKQDMSEVKVAVNEFQNDVVAHATLANDLEQSVFVHSQLDKLERQATLRVDVNTATYNPNIHVITPVEYEATPFLRVKAMKIENTAHLIVYPEKLGAEILLNFDVLTTLAESNLLLDLLPTPYNYELKMFVRLHKIEGLSFLGFSLGELKITTKVQMMIYRTVVKSLLQWFLQRGTVSNEGFSNEVIFDLENSTPGVPTVPEPPGTGGDWSGGYVEYPFYGMGQKGTDVADGYVSPEADKWVKNATMFWNKAQDIFEDE